MKARALCGLLRAAALCRGAEFLYALAGEIHGIEIQPWRSLTFDEKRRWYQGVEALVREHAPSRVMADLSPVVSAGEPPTRSSVGSAARPGSLFDVAVDLARTDARRVLAFRGQDTSDGRD